MSESFHFETVEMLTVGTLGPKGERVFYLQCLAEGELVSLKFEKQQAAALAEYLDRVLSQLPEADAGEPPATSTCASRWWRPGPSAPWASPTTTEPTG